MADHDRQLGTNDSRVGIALSRRQLLKLALVLLLSSVLAACAPSTLRTPFATEWPSPLPPEMHTVAPTNAPTFPPTETLSRSPITASIVQDMSPTITASPTPPPPTATMTASPSPEPSKTPTKRPPTIEPPKLTATREPERPPATIVTTVFKTHFDNGFAGFVYEGNTIARPGAPGQSDTAKYGVANEKDRGNVFKAVQTEVSRIEDGITRAFVQLAVKDITGSNVIKGSFGTHFKVRVSGMDAGLKLGKDANWNKWLSLWSAFDSGYPNYHQAVFVQVDGSDGNYVLTTGVCDPNGKNVALPRKPGSPLFDVGRWIDIRVEVDIANKKVYTYQDGILISEGPYMAGTDALSETHWGLYNKGIQTITLENDDIEIYQWQ